MPSLETIASVLSQYEGRYEFLDAFADDVDDLGAGAAVTALNAQPSPTEAVFETIAGHLMMQLFPDQGIARFRLAKQGAGRGNHDQVATGATLGALIGAAVSTASKKKEDLLGGLIVGMLVGSFLGAASTPVERVLALKFDASSGSWQVYDGPLLRWAKRTLHPAVPPAA